MMTTGRADRGSADWVRPRRRFAQHFLESGWVPRVVAACAPQPGDAFIEIGPGRGALTLPLASAAAAVIAIELDRDLARQLADRVPSNVEVVCADALAADWPGLLARAASRMSGEPRRVRIAGNLPYNISSPLLFRLLAAYRSQGLVRDATLMLQREVAERLAAPPGSRTYGVLGILASLHADVEAVLRLPRGAFRPVPRVDSTLVRLTFRPPSVPIADLARFEALVRSLFTRRRKMLVNALGPFARRHGIDARAALSAAGLSPSRRPETLELEDFERLARAFPAVPGLAVL